MNKDEGVLFKHLTEAISSLACEIRESREQRQAELEWFKSHFHLATKQDLEKLENIMATLKEAFTDYAAKQKVFNERQGRAIDSAVESITGLASDIKLLNDKITELQNSAGPVTPEDQALIDELQTQGEALVTRVEGAATGLKTLDEQTPPIVPVPTA